jgi:5-oxoprolinase (ATP-hydrolysing) subunit A
MTAGTCVDLNCDMGEGFGPWLMGDDAAMLDIVASANLACGFHAGDPVIMTDTARLAREKGVAIGAHPSFLDLWGFGRRRISGDSPANIEKMVAYQIGALQGVAALAGHCVSHVKPHGALYNMAAADPELAGAIARAIRGVDADLLFVVLPGSEMERAGRAAGLRVACEVFADRGYLDDGRLAPRGQPGALIHDPEAAARRTVEMVTTGRVRALSGRSVPVAADTICIHGDTPAAVAMARAVRGALAAAGVAIRPMHETIAA